MGEIDIMTSCAECGTDFDDDEDTTACNCCHAEFCEDCQEKHAKDVLFEEKNMEISNLIKHVEKRVKDEIRKKETKKKK